MDFKDLEQGKAIWAKALLFGEAKHLTEFQDAFQDIRWLNTVSSTYIWMGRYNPSLSLDATIMVSKNCSIIGEHVVIIF